MSTLCYNSLSKTPLSKTGGNYWYLTLWMICNKIEKYRKRLRKDLLEKDLTFFSNKW